MAKYKLESLSVGIGGKVYRKEEGVVFDTKSNFKRLKNEVEASVKAGFLKKLTKKEEAELSKAAAEEARKAEEAAAEEARKAEEAAAEEARKKNKGNKS